MSRSADVRASTDSRDTIGRSLGQGRARAEGNDGRYLYDILELEGEYVEGFSLLEQTVLSGKIMRDAVPLNDVRDYCLDCVSRLPMEAKQLRTRNPYQQRVGPKLLKLTEELTVKYSTEGENG